MKEASIVNFDLYLLFWENEGQWYETSALYLSRKERIAVSDILVLAFDFFFFFFCVQSASDHCDERHNAG